ncbi:hypothetical protein ABTZ58_36160 [Streptomyces sp. NPDC094143]|uniref:hypothetical protein n=1 Tax=Streptomyces sp. NPDC094143 TaxID=3155310 RepID=UPI00333259EA
MVSAVSGPTRCAPEFRPRRTNSAGRSVIRRAATALAAATLLLAVPGPAQAEPPTKIHILHAKMGEYSQRGKSGYKNSVYVSVKYQCQAQDNWNYVDITLYRRSGEFGTGWIDKLECDGTLKERRGVKIESMANMGFQPGTWKVDTCFLQADGPPKTQYARCDMQGVRAHKENHPDVSVSR